MGAEEADKGSVKASDGAIIGYLRQDFNYTSHTIREEMEDAWKDALYYKKDRMETLARELKRQAMRNWWKPMAGRKPALNFWEATTMDTTGKF